MKAKRRTLPILSACAAALILVPVLALSAIGVMRPLEGFCMEGGQGRVESRPPGYVEGRSYFSSPELGHRYQRLAPHLNWPVCISSRRGEHMLRAAEYDRALSRLGEPNLRHLHLTEPTARVFRVLVVPSFSRGRISFRVEMNRSGSGTLHASWFVDKKPYPPAPRNRTNLSEMAGVLSAWDREVLPVRSVQRSISPAEAEALWVLVRRAHAQDVFVPALDVNSLEIERVENGQRTVGDLTLRSPPNIAGQLFCALVAESEVPSPILENNDVKNVCPTQTQ